MFEIKSSQRWIYTVLHACWFNRLVNVYFVIFAHVQQVEPFLCDCISVSKRLARAIEPFTEEAMPQTIKEAEESIHKSRLVRRKTLDALHIDDLADEGSRINAHMKMTRRLEGNPEFSNTLVTITKLMEQIDTVKGRLETLWNTRQDKLETNLKQQVFENNAKQVKSHLAQHCPLLYHGSTLMYINMCSLDTSCDLCRSINVDIEFSLSRSPCYLLDQC